MYRRACAVVRCRRLRSTAGGWNGLFVWFREEVDRRQHNTCGAIIHSLTSRRLPACMAGWLALSQWERESTLAPLLLHSVPPVGRFCFRRLAARSVLGSLGSLTLESNASVTPPCVRGGGPAFLIACSPVGFKAWRMARGRFPDPDEARDRSGCRMIPPIRPPARFPPAANSGPADSDAGQRDVAFGGFKLRAVTTACGPPGPGTPGCAAQVWRARPASLPPWRLPLRPAGGSLCASTAVFWEAPRPRPGRTWLPDRGRRFDSRPGTRLVQ